MIKVTPNDVTIAVRVSVDVHAIEQARIEAETDREDIEAFEISSSDDLHFANAQFEKYRLLEKGLVGIWNEGVKPLNTRKALIKKLIGPAELAVGFCVTTLRDKIGRYQLAQDEQQRELYSDASEQLAELSHEELHEALTVAQDAAPEALQGTSVKFKYQVKRVNMSMLSDDWKAPKYDALNEYAKRCGDEEPIIPGVIWERVPVVRATGRG